MKIFLFLLLVILVLTLAAWLFPAAAPALAIGLVLISLGFAIFAAVRKHRTAYLLGRITRSAYVRNIFLDVAGMLLAVACAGLLGRYVAQMLAGPTDNALIRMVAGILIGMLVGIAAGLLVNWAWRRLLVKASLKN